MTKLDNAVFNRPVFGSAKAANKAPAWRAAEGLGTIFAAMLAREMRRALAQDGKGLTGTGSAADAGLYGVFFDQAMGKALDQSAAMAPFNALIERSIANLPGTEPSGTTPTRAAGATSDAPKQSQESAARVMDGIGSVVHDSLGPVLLPPQSSYMAPILPPPTAVEG